MRAVALAVGLAVVVVVAAPCTQAATPAGHGRAEVKVKCHWTKATKKSRRLRVCVRLKAAAPPKPKAPAAVTPIVVPVSSPVPPAADPAPAEPVVDAAAPTAPAAPGPAVARLQVMTKEFAVTLSRASIAAGPATIQLLNAGDDPHDLHLRPAEGGADLIATPETAPGGVVDRDVTLAAGRYTLYCALPTHEDLGMRATLTVR